MKQIKKLWKIILTLIMSGKKFQIKSPLQGKNTGE